MLKALLVIIIVIVVVIIGYIVYQRTAPEEITPSAVTGQGETAGSYVDVSPARAKELMDTFPDLTVIDVSPDYAAGHLPGAVSYYLGDGSLDRAIPNLNKYNPYLVYCHVDSAAISGAQKLVDAGFTKVYRLEGNYSAWIDGGYTIGY